MKFIFFWGHTPAPGEQIGKFCFSQWFEAPFKVDERIYKTAEHYMMAQKAKLFGDEDLFQQIISANKPGEAKALGREIKQFDHEIWDLAKFEIVVKGNYNKFLQHPNLKNYLISTGNRIIAEASPVDLVWGIGLAENNPAILNVNDWPGLNLLGFALMKVRHILSSGDGSNN